DDALAWKTVVDQQNLVRKGRFAIWQSGNQTIVYSPKNFRFENAFHPFDLAMSTGWGPQFSSPASAIASAEAGHYEGVELTTQEKVIRDGNEFVLLKYRTAGDNFDADFYIDRRRGYLPFFTDYFERPSGELRARQLILEVRREG